MLFKIQHIPNLITMTRIIGVSFIFWLTPYTTDFWQVWIAVGYIAVCLTDFLDGWIARKLNSESDLGKILDPLADKILVLVFLPLLEMQVISAFPVFIILAREFTIMALRVILAKDGIVLGAKLSGKIKTAITLPVCGILLGRVAVEQTGMIPTYLEPLNDLAKWIYMWPNWVMDTLIWATVFVTIWSFLDYFGQFIWSYALKEEKGDKKKVRQRILGIIPNIISTLNMGFGFLAIIFAIKTKIMIASAFVLCGIFCDVMDGKVARKLNVESAFGKDLDTKADFITFGIAPAIIIFVKLVALLGQVGSVAVAMIYLLSVFYRLKRFSKTGHSETFEGLPSPVGAIFVVAVSHSMIIGDTLIQSMLILLTAILMVTALPYPHARGIRKTGLKYFVVPSQVSFLLAIPYFFGVGAIELVYPMEWLIVLNSLYIAYPFFNLAALRKK